MRVSHSTLYFLSLLGDYGATHILNSIDYSSSGLDPEVHWDSESGKFEVVQRLRERKLTQVGMGKVWFS